MVQWTNCKCWDCWSEEVENVRRMFNRPRRFPRSWKLNENSLHISIQLIFSTEVPLPSNITSEHILHLSRLGRSWGKKVMVEIGMFHSPPFTNSHFQFIITLESSTSNCDSSVFEVHFLHIRPRCAVSTCAIFITDVHSTALELRAPFSDLMHLITPPRYTSFNWLCISTGKYVSPVKTESRFAGQRLQCRCHYTSTYPWNSTWLTVAPSVVCWPCCKWFPPNGK